MLCCRIRFVLAAWLGLAWFTAAQAVEPKAARSPQAIAREIDAHIQKRLAKEKIPASPPAEDSEFLRRASLHLTGRLPSAERVVSFLESKEANNRQKLIDELLASPQYGEHFSNSWSQLITAEEPKYRKEMAKWLAGEFSKDTPWSRIVTELLTHEGAGPKMGFVMSNIDNNQPQPNKLAGATSRLFMGVQLHCAECHNHPFTNWKQSEFWGVAAFFSRVKFQPAKGKEQPAGILETVAAPKGKNPPAKGASIVIPTTAGKNAGKAIAAKFLEGNEPNLPDQGAVRAKLAEWMTSPANKFFARAFANRQWAHFFGHGIVQPVDDLHDDNPAAHPEVLQLLTEEFKASSFDVKHLVRCICSTQAARHRTSRPLPANKDDAVFDSHMNVQVVNAEVLYEALTQAFGVTQVKIDAGPTAGSANGRSSAGGTARDKFIKFFSTSDSDASPTDYTHGIPQALSLMNDPAFNTGGPTVEKLMKAHTQPEKVIEGLFLATLSRLPTSEETKLMTDYLARRPDRRQGYAGILWMLVNTEEFVLIR